LIHKRNCGRVLEIAKDQQLWLTEALFCARAAIPRRTVGTKLLEFVEPKGSINAWAAMTAAHWFEQAELNYIVEVIDSK
jgi:hypothetical protein